MSHTGLYFHWQGGRAAAVRYRTAVSLHSHTLHSREVLSVAPAYARHIPLASQALRAFERHYRNRFGVAPDYSRAWWTSPLPPREAFDVERLQIEDKLGLTALVSITDHDEIEACLRLRVLEQARRTPVSVEWTVPTGGSFLHLGLHNLPAESARDRLAELRRYTERPSPARLAVLLAWLHQCPSTLIVLNHPLWDEARLGQAEHCAMVADFLARHSAWIHALELNGSRSWKENGAVQQLARRFNKPLVSGGDRHSLEPNANLNLTNAASFEEFAAEVRCDGFSDVLFMPQYREPLRLRYLEAFRDIVRDYPQYPGRVHWTDRVYYIANEGNIKSLSQAWARTALGWTDRVIALAGLVESRRVRSALRMALSEGQEAPL